MLTGVLVPTSGVVEVAGIVPWRDRERNARQIGVVFGQRTGLWWDLPLRDSFQLVATMYDVPRRRFRANMAVLTDLLGLDKFIDTPVRQLSLGQRMRGDLAAAMLHEPRILYLDEPTIGLDVVVKARIRAFIAGLNRSAGTTIVLTTHDLADVEQMCTRVILIDRGRVLYDGDIAQLKARYAPYRELTVRLADPMAAIDVPGAHCAQTDDVVVLRFDPTRVAKPILFPATAEVATSNRMAGCCFAGAAIAIGLVPRRVCAPKVGTTLGWVAVMHIPTMSACAASMAWCPTAPR